MAREGSYALPCLPFGTVGLALLIVSLTVLSAIEKREQLGLVPRNPLRVSLFVATTRSSLDGVASNYNSA